MSLFLSGFFLSLSLCLDLGIVNVAMIRAAIQKGMKPAFAIGVGSSFGDLIYAILSLIGISFLLDIVLVRWFLWIGGTAILLYLTWGMIRESFRPKVIHDTDQTRQPTGSLSKDFGRGLGLALASPSALLWFVTVGGSVIASSQMDSQSSLLTFFGGFFIASLLWCLVLTGIVSHGGKRLGPRLGQICSGISAVLFLYFAVKVFVDGYQTLL